MNSRNLLLALFSFLTTSLFCQVWEAKAPGTLPVDYYVSDISIVNEQVIWAVAIDYSQANPPVPPTHITKLLKSADGGDTWEVKDIEEVMGRISLDIHAFDENTAIITTQNLQSAAGRGLWRTTDGGENWNEEHPGSDGGYWVHFFDEQEGICINRQSMARTTDGGVTWNSIPPANIPDFQSGENTGMNTSATSLEAFGDILWFGTTKGRVFRSLDRGQNWEVFPSGFGNNAPIFSTAFVDEKNGIALYENSNEPDHEHFLIKTSDGGESWNSLDYDYDFEEVTAIPCSRVFMGVNWEDNITAISTNLGETWTLLDVETSPWAPVFKSPNLGWMANGSEAGADPALYKWVGDALYDRTFVNKNASGNNDGTSWADAFSDLQDALAAAEEGGEIWVAEGTYLPGGDPNATFLIDKTIQLYGGFAGTECNLLERDIEQHPTILSGDMNGDDVDDDFENHKDDNVMTLVTVGPDITNATVIDGFMIRNGHSNGDSWPNEDGAGIHSQGAPVIRNCFFTQNFAKNQGGAILQNTASTQSIIIEACIFDKNASIRGGAAYVYYSAYQIVDCDFLGNAAVSNLSFGAGGGILINGASGTISNCLFEDNISEKNGGGIFVVSWVDINDVTLTLENCTFNGNTAGIFGGGLGLTISDSIQAVVRNCILQNNSGPFGAAVGISGMETTPSQNADIRFENCLMTGNTGDEAIRIQQIGQIQLLNCSIASNDCGSITLGTQSFLEFQNTIFYNPGFEEFTVGGDFTSLGGNLIGDLSLDGLLDPSDQQNLDPLFIATGEFPLSENSPCINRGINDGVTALYDLVGNDRIQEGTVDIGAYESPFVTSDREVIAGEVQLLPNPATDFLYIQLPEGITQPHEISLFDATGRLMGRQMSTIGQAIDLQGLAPGMYWVKAVVGERVYTGKFSKL